MWLAGMLVFTWYLVCLICKIWHWHKCLQWGGHESKVWFWQSTGQFIQNVFFIFLLKHFKAWYRVFLQHYECFCMHTAEHLSVWSKLEKQLKMKSQLLVRELSLVVREGYHVFIGGADRQLRGRQVESSRYSGRATTLAAQRIKWKYYWRWADWRCFRVEADHVS